MTTPLLHERFATLAILKLIAFLKLLAFLRCSTECRLHLLCELGILKKTSACRNGGWLYDCIKIESILREVGLTLPEDCSREGCGVEVQKSRRAARRQLGCLRGARKNQDLFVNSCFWYLRRPLFLAARMGI